MEQTEIDALATLQPDVLREIVERAFDPYVDRTLEDRVEVAEAEWLEQAQQAINAQINPAIMATVREQATTKLAELRSEIDALNEQLELATDGFDLPEIEVPEAAIDETAERQALVSISDNFVTASRALIARKSYGNGNGS